MNGALYCLLALLHCHSEKARVLTLTDDSRAHMRFFLHQNSTVLLKTLFRVRFPSQGSYRFQNPYKACCTIQACLVVNSVRQENLR